jgi:uncharacterized membrane protein YheB (UPF0754 family)
LIALQVNNWNETRKRAMQEKAILTELRNTIISDYEILNMGIEGNIKVQQSCSIILSHFEQNLPYHDSLSLHFERSNLWWRILLRTNTFDRLKQFGMDFIKNDETKNMISDLYERNLSFGRTLDERQSLFHYTTITPILLDLFESIDKTWFEPKNGNVPLDYEALKSNQKYKSILRTNIGNRGYYNDWLQVTLEQMTNLDTSLLEEIEKI